MKTKRGLCLHILIWSLLPTMAIFGQCPEREVLRERISSLQFQGVSPELETMELEGYRAQIKSCAQQGDTLFAYLLQTLGALYSSQSNFKQAIKRTYEAIDLLNGSKTDTPDKYAAIAKCYYNLGLYYGSLGMIAEKHHANDSCISIALNHKYTSEDGLTAVLERSIELIKTGNVEIGYKLTQAGLASAQKSNLSDTRVAKQLTTWKLSAQIQLNDLKSAETEVPERINLFQQLKDTPLLALTLIQLGDILSQKGNLSRSLDYFNEAFVFSKAVNYSEGCAYSLHRMASLYSDRVHDIRTAQIYFKQALQYSSPQESAFIFEDLANLYASMRLFDSSRMYYHLVLGKISPGLNAANLVRNAELILDSTNSEYVVGIIMKQTDLWLRKYNADARKPYLDSALKGFRQVDLLFDKLRRMDVGGLSKIYFGRATRTLYEHALEASQLSGNMESALYFMERSRFVRLYSDLVKLNWLNKEDFKAHDEILKEIVFMQRNLAVTAEKDANYELLRKGILNSRQKLMEQERGMKNKNPLCYNVFLDTSAIDLYKLQTFLHGQNQWIVETFTGDSVIYILTITHNSGWIKKLAKAGYDRLASDYMQFLRDAAASNSHFQQFQETSGRLYRQIFGEDSPPLGRMVVSEDSHYFPFESLVSGAGVSGPHYLVEDYPVSYIYSARHLLSSATMMSNSGGTDFLGFAPVQFNAFPGVAPLPASDESLKKAGHFFNEYVLLTGPKATRTQFLDQFYNHHIVQLYARGTDSSIKGEPVIYFSDSALLLNDLSGDTKPLTRLIVLSGGQSGAGKQDSEEGSFGFNRSFAALGIPASITNLWLANNEATYKITESFYQYLTKGDPTDVALQKAKLDYLHSAGGEMKLPTYWAAAVLVGNGDQFKIEKGLNWKMILMGSGIPLLLVAIIGWFVYKRRKAAA